MNVGPHAGRPDEWEPNDDRKPWDVDPSWSKARAEAFAEYRDFGTKRNHRAVAQRLGKTAALISRWSSEDRWVSRCAQYDAYLDSLRRDELQQQIIAMTKRHAEALEGTWEVLAAPAMELARRMKERGAIADMTNASDDDLMRAAVGAAQVLPKLVQAERLVRGVSTEVLGIEGATDKTLEDADAYLIGLATGDEALQAAPVDEPLQLPPGDDDA